MEWKGSKGEWIVASQKNKSETDVCTSTHRICEVKHYNTPITGLEEPTIEEGLANAELIADAGNTIQSCNLLPSELLQQRNELLETCKLALETLNVYVADGYIMKGTITENRLKQVINKVTK